MLKFDSGSFKRILLDVSFLRMYLNTLSLYFGLNVNVKHIENNYNPLGAKNNDSHSEKQAIVKFYT